MVTGEKREDYEAWGGSRWGTDCRWMSLMHDSSWPCTPSSNKLQASRAVTGLLASRAGVEFGQVSSVCSDC
jgi:hypothetical protein